jgi:hypothetical protein
MEHHHVPIQACGEELAVLSHRRSHFLNAIEWWECSHLLDNLHNIFHRQKTTFTQKVTSAASTGAKAGAKSKSVFKRFASSFVGCARRQRGAAAEPEVAGPATRPATMSVRTAMALALGVIAAAGAMKTGHGI